jgi:hypothetical protein
MLRWHHILINVYLIRLIVPVLLLMSHHFRENLAHFLASPVIEADDLPARDISKPV